MDKSDPPSAGLALGLPASAYPQALPNAGGDPCFFIARGDPGREIEFPDWLCEMANMQEGRWKPKRLCATWPRYNPPDPEEPEHKQ